MWCSQASDTGRGRRSRAKYSSLNEKDSSMSSVAQTVVGKTRED